MQLSLRGKLNVIVVSVTATFIFLTAISMYLNSELENQTSVIRNRYIPLVELGYNLDADFESIGQHLRDGVSAQDTGLLDSATQLKIKLVNDLNAAADIIGSQNVGELKTAIEDYFEAALDTSKRLIKGETGLKIVDSMVIMQAKRKVATDLLDKAAKFDRTKMAAAFDSITEAQKRTDGIRLLLSLVCVVLTFLISYLMGRALILRLKDIQRGLERFGRGDFTEVIPVKGNDEISILSRQVNTMAGQTQSLMRELESFSYSIAHDLRAPLRSIIGFGTALSQEHSATLDAEGKMYLDRIVASGNRMGQMIEGLLNISKLNRKSLVKENVNLSKIAENAVETLKSNSTQHNPMVNIEKDVFGFCDEKLLDIVISNLINNAWKFTRNTPQASIHFGSKKEKDSVVYFVKDNGAGFDMSHSDKLFGTFQRLHSEKEFEGHGIGLATVKNIIDKHSGRIWDESEINKGTTFYFTLQ